MQVIHRAEVPADADFSVEHYDRATTGIKELEKALRAKGLLKGVTITAVNVGGTFTPIVIKVAE